MKAAFDALVLPQYRVLSRSLGLTEASFDENYDVIPVKVTFKSGTTQIIEDGMVSECDHQGATMGDVELCDIHYDPNTGNVEDTARNYRMLVCDQCNAWKIPEGGEWNE